MIPHSRRQFLKSLTLAGAAIFTAHHLKCIELDATEPKDPEIIVGPYRKTWRDLYAEDTADGYRLTVDAPTSDFEGMTWREVVEVNNDDDMVDALERIKELGLDGDAYNLSEIICDNEQALAAFAAADGIANDPSEGPTWYEVLELTENDIISTLEDFGNTDLKRVSDLDEICEDWYDRVGPFQAPEGKAYLEVVDLLDSIKSVDSELYDAARECFDIIEGSCPGNDFHGVFVQTREDLGILRRILHAADIKVNIHVC